MCVLAAVPVLVLAACRPWGSKPQLSHQYRYHSLDKLEALSNNFCGARTWTQQTRLKKVDQTPVLPIDWHARSKCNPAFLSEQTPFGAVETTAPLTPNHSTTYGGSRHAKNPASYSDNDTGSVILTSISSRLLRGPVFERRFPPRSHGNG